MKIDKFEDNWLFLTHSPDEISNWVKHLNFFYFCRAWGGHANDGDSFECNLKYSDKADLQNKLSKLGISLEAIPEDYPRAVHGQSYSYEEFKKFKNEIKDFPELEQPGHKVIEGIKCFIWAEKGIISLRVFGTNSEPYYVTDADFQSCKALEIIFDKAGFKNDKDTNIENSASCISRKKYPELFSDTVDN